MRAFHFKGFRGLGFRALKFNGFLFLSIFFHFVCYGFFDSHVLPTFSEMQGSWFMRIVFLAEFSGFGVWGLGFTA